MKNTNVLKRNNGDQPLSFSNVIDDIFQNNLRHFFDESPWGTEGSTRSGVPVNIRETEENYELDVVAPGCKKEGFKIDIEGSETEVFENMDEATLSKVGAFAIEIHPAFNPHVETLIKGKLARFRYTSTGGEYSYFQAN